MDIKEIIIEVVNMIKKDESLAERFKSDPVKTIESIVKVDLPGDGINLVINGVKAAMGGDKTGVMDNLKKMF